jgi:Rod binding domain-containing protein
MLRQLIGEMRKGALADDIFGSSANSTYRELADARTADALAQRGAIGIAAMIERQLCSSPSSSEEGQRDLASKMPSRSGVESIGVAQGLKHPTPTPPLKGRGFRSDL